MSLSILNTGSITTLPTSASTCLKWKIKKKNVEKSEWNCEEYFFPQMSAFWCDHWNEGVNRLTRWQSFFEKNSFVGMLCIPQGSFVVLSFYGDLLVISWF